MATDKSGITMKFVQSSSIQIKTFKSVEHCQHKITQPSPSSEKEQDRASSTSKRQERRSISITSTGLRNGRGCTSEIIFLTTLIAIHFRAFFFQLGYMHTYILKAAVYNSELLVPRFHMYYLKSDILSTRFSYQKR